MPPGRYTHRREFTARDLWDACPKNRYFGVKGRRHDPDSELYHRWKPIIATTNVFMAEASVFKLLTWIKQHWVWSKEELWDVFACTPTRHQEEWNRINCTPAQLDIEEQRFNVFYQNFTHRDGIAVQPGTPEMCMLLAVVLFGIPSPFQQHTKPRAAGSWYYDDSGRYHQVVIAELPEYDPLLGAPKLSNDRVPKATFLLSENFADWYRLWNSFGRLVAVMIGWPVQWPVAVNRELNKHWKAKGIFLPKEVPEGIRENAHDDYRQCPSPMYARDVPETFWAQQGVIPFRMNGIPEDEEVASEPPPQLRNPAPTLTAAVQVGA